MKNIKYLIITLAVGMMLIGSSCKKTFYTDANINHNAPPYVPPVDLLPVVEIGIAYTQGGDVSRYTSMLTQQTAGVSRQSAGYYTYIFTSQDFDTPWGNLYTSSMENCKNYMNVSDAAGYNGHSGIARLLMAYCLQMTVDCWGNVPYSQAFMGVNNLNPVYDQASSVYSVIAQLVNDGIGFMNKDSLNAVSLQPGAEDFIYGGNPASWIQFGHSILARLYIHQSKNNPAMAASALAQANMGISSSANNAQVFFSNTGTGNGPWYQFNTQRDDINFAFYSYPQQTTFGALLTSTNDPRYGFLIDSTGELTTGIGLAPYYGNANSPVEFITYEEMQFIVAEATLRNGGSGATAQAAYTNAITANMTKLGVGGSAIASYLTTYGNITGASTANALDSVGNQEYIALYLNPEAFTTWRRIGYPVLTPPSGSQGASNGIPRRFLYPQTEYSYNGSSVNAQGTVTLWAPKLFWDN
jgi:hypothetical protein